MRLLFMLVIGALAVADTFSIGMSLGPGLSVKNALIYPIALGLMFRMSVTGRFRLRLPVLNAAFVIWVAYAILTWIACVTLIHYPGYEARATGISLKSLMMDSAIFFFTFFYGVDRESDFFVLSKTLAFAVCAANILTLADVAGIIHLGITIGSEGVEAGRVFGVFGHANDTAALIVCLLPMLAAVATTSRGWVKGFWYIGGLASIVVLMLTVSRGAYVGVAVGYGCALWLCRRYLPTSRVVAWVLIGVSALIVAIAVAAAVLPQFVQVMTERIFNQSMAVSASTASSGRTSLWLATLDAMAAHPITFLTGFGWRTHQLMFSLVTHNDYLDQWFELGLIGLFAFLTILQQTVAAGLRAVAAADRHLRPYMIALVFGMLGLAVSIFFVNLERPWDYIWIYVGFTLRAAADAVEKAQSPSLHAAAVAEEAQPTRASRGPSGYAPGARARARAARPRLVGDVRR
jgi:O-antigen ligase